MDNGPAGRHLWKPSRPLTGSGSAGPVADMIQRYGEDSIFVKMAAVLFG